MVSGIFGDKGSNTVTNLFPAFMVFHGYVYMRIVKNLIQTKLQFGLWAWVLEGNL